MKKLAIWLKTKFMSEDGQGMVEYGLIIALVAIVVIAAVALLGKNISNIFNETASKLVSNSGT